MHDTLTPPRLPVLAAQDPALARESALRLLATAVAEGRPAEAVRVLADRLAPLATGAAGARALEEAERLVAVAEANAAERARLLRLAATDPLTGLANRRAFRQELSGELARATRHRRPLTLALIDIDRFKRVNDTWGHETGDAVLGAVGTTLARCARAGDAIGRIGGEEFGWLMPETSLPEALAAVERARVAVAARRVGGVQVTVSCGVSGAEGVACPDGLLREADRALYAAKDAGRDRVVAADAGSGRVA